MSLWDAPMGSRAGRAALAIGGLAAGLLAAEAVARLALPHWRPPWAERAAYWRHDPLLGWAHRPGRAGVYSGPGFRVRVAINSRGLRDREHPLDRPPGGPPRLVLLGDSFGWGYGVDQDSTLAARLDRGPALEALNASVSGYCTTQQLLWYRVEGRRYRPDVLLLLVCGNDLHDNVGPRLYWYRKPYFEPSGDTLALRGVPVPAPTWGDRVHMFVVGRTYLGTGLREAWWRLRARARGSGTAAPVNGGVGAAGEDSSAFRLTAAILRALASETRADDVRLALALIPMEAGLTAWWRERAADLGLPVLDLRPAVGVGPEVLLPRDTHWNALGHARAAAAVGPFVDSVLASGRR